MSLRLRLPCADMLVTSCSLLQRNLSRTQCTYHSRCHFVNLKCLETTNERHKFLKQTKNAILQRILNQDGIIIYVKIHTATYKLYFHKPFLHGFGLTSNNFTKRPEKSELFILQAFLFTNTRCFVLRFQTMNFYNHIIIPLKQNTLDP